MKKGYYINKSDFYIYLIGSALFGLIIGGAFFWNLYGIVFNGI